MILVAKLVIFFEFMLTSTKKLIKFGLFSYFFFTIYHLGGREVGIAQGLQ